MNTDHTDNTFGSWVFSRQAVVERAVGGLMLLVELFFFIASFFRDVPEQLISQLINFFFLMFMYLRLKEPFAKRYAVPANDRDLHRILRFPQADTPSGLRTTSENITNLVNDCNLLIRQLSNINKFILATVAVYLILIIHTALHYAKLSWVEAHANLVTYFFHLAIIIPSYIGAFYLLRGFFVMYETTVGDNGEDILARATSNFGFLIVVLIVADAVISITKPGMFLSEAFCGAVNAVIFILFVARFENRLLDIAPAALAALYLYAILQVCLPFVTQDFFRLINVSNVNLDRFTNFVLIVVLLGKVTLLAVLHYVLNSGRIFYYFLTLRKFHLEDEGRRDWEVFRQLVTEFEEETEVFTIHYARQRDGSYVATIPGLFKEFNGQGRTPSEAKKRLVYRICGDSK